MEETKPSSIDEKKEKNNEVEEISEKRTSFLGYILLFIMVVFLIIVGQTIFSDLKDMVERPDAPSSCVSLLNTRINRTDYYESNSSGLSNLSYLQNDCNFGEIDKQFGLDTSYNTIKPKLNEIVNLNNQMNNLRQNIRQKENEANRLNSQYDISLQEKMAGEQNPVMDKGLLQSGIVNQQSVIADNQAQITKLTSQRDKIIAEITPSVTQMLDKLKQATDAYEREMAIYSLKVFGLKFIFIFPFFAFSLFYYLRLKKKNSSYTIIYTAIVTATSLLFVEIILIMLYEIIPRELIEKIFEFFRSMPFLRYILYYGSVFIVLGIFGGSVYYIQKRVYNPKNVAMRRLRDNKCPGCSFLINIYYNYCPKCGKQLKEKCPNCGDLKISDLPCCPNCGRK